LSNGYSYAVNAFDPKINGWQEVLNDENTDNITIANPSASNLIIFASGNNNFNTEMQKANKPSQKTSDGTAEFFEIQQGGFQSVNISITKKAPVPLKPGGTGTGTTTTTTTGPATTTVPLKPGGTGTGTGTGPATTTTTTTSTVTAASIDPRDGIKILNPINTKGLSYSMVALMKLKDDPEIVLDGDDSKDPQLMTEGAVKYFRIFSRKGRFASTGKPNWTSRTHIVPKVSSGNPLKGISNAREKGFLVSDKDLKNLEFTIIAKVNNIKDDSETYSMKVRGGPHDGNKETTLCCEAMHPYVKMKDKQNLYSAEATHPHYRFESVKLEQGVIKYPNTNWIGLKQIVISKDNKSLHMELWADYDPLDTTTGKPKNNWVKVWEIDDAKEDTPTWGGKYTTLRVDQVDSVDVHTMNVHEILPSP
jgi:hypothetical protein